MDATRSRALAKRLIAAYHQVQPTIVQGDLYRLISPRNGSEFSATQTVSRDKSQAVVFAFIHSTQKGRIFPTLKLKGLDPAAEYALSPSRARRAWGCRPTASGAWWMNHGLDMDIEISAETFRRRRSGWTGSDTDGNARLGFQSERGSCFPRSQKRDLGHPAVWQEKQPQVLRLRSAQDDSS